MKKIFIFISIIIFLWTAGLIAFGERIHGFKKDTKTKADAIVVLTGGKNRIKVGTNLLAQEFASKMFISGVSKEISINEIKDENNISEIDEDKIEIGQEAKNTIENAKEIDTWIKENNIQSIRLVTSNYHIPRTLEEIRGLNPDIEIIIHPVYSENISSRWWQKWNTLKFIMKEYNKFLYVHSKNKINGIIQGIIKK